VQSQAINVGVQRAQLEHAMAVLTGKAPAELKMAEAPLTQKIPLIPPAVPSVLLERRPDIAAAERQMAGASAQIGVAISAYFPSLTLSASYGYFGTVLGTLFQASNSLWSVGPTVAETVFDAGARSAQVASARAAYDQSTAFYRQTVLAAFQQVEDELAAQNILAQQADVITKAVSSAHESERLTLSQYKAGTVPYSSVLLAQIAALGDEQSELAVRQSRILASVALIEALGGGWEATQLTKQ
jgi:NodT family efflux transporter outer membrane factor (OMF) lipoprotein